MKAVSFRTVGTGLLYAAATLAGLVSTTASAQAPAANAWPQKPVHMIISGAAGASNDVLARVLFQNAPKTLGQPVVIDNRPGAFGNIAGAALARSEADGYTYMLTTNGPLTLNKFLYKGRIQYDPLRDFAPVAVVADVPLVVVARADLPANNLKELVELGKKKEKGLSIGSPGAGSLGHLTGELLRVQSGASALSVPFNGSPASVNALMGGQIEVVVDTISQFEAQIRAKQVKLLAVLSAQRSPDFPDVPTAIEQGYPDMDVTIYYAIAAPKSTPPAIIARMNAEVNAALENPDVKARLKTLSMRAVGGSTQDLADRMSDRTIEKWRVLIDRIGFKLD